MNEYNYSKEHMTQSRLGRWYSGNAVWRLDNRRMANNLARFMTRFADQGHAEDVVLRHRYNYYVLGCALITDEEYDALERQVKAQWSVCVCGIGGEVGSDFAGNYPRYIQLGARPLPGERFLRDRAIADRWMNNL